MALASSGLAALAAHYHNLVGRKGLAGKLQPARDMVAFSQRLAEFVTDRDAPAGAAVEALCKDHVGTYVLPFPCRRDGAAWYNCVTSAALDCDVIGWREWQERTRSRV